jgi:hypothetical protein
MYHTVGIVPKSNRSIGEQANSIPISIHIEDHSLAWQSTDTAIKCAGVKLVLWTQHTSPFLANLCGGTIYYKITKCAGIKLVLWTHHPSPFLVTLCGGTRHYKVIKCAGAKLVLWTQHPSPFLLKLCGRTRYYEIIRCACSGYTSFMNPIPPPFSYIAYVVVQDIIKKKKPKTKKKPEFAIKIIVNNKKKPITG